MREMCELRVNEEVADLLFDPREGKRLNGVRLIMLDTSDPRFPEVGRLRVSLSAQGKGMFFSGWDITRHYSKTELAAAALFHVLITAVFEPSGEDCGTVFDYGQTCPICSAGRRQVTDLWLDLRRVPKNKDIARTITAGEWIVSERLARLFVDASLTGFELGPVRHKARYEDDPLDLSQSKSGRELLRRAADVGCPHPTPAFWTWLNRREQRELSDRATAEYVEMRRARSRAGGQLPPRWYQLCVTSPRVPTVPPTRFGINPFDEDREGRYRCSISNLCDEDGHVSGLNVLSEVFISRERYGGDDFVCTRDYVGGFKDWYIPGQLLLVTPRVRNLLVEHKIRGWRGEIAYLRS